VKPLLLALLLLVAAPAMSQTPPVRGAGDAAKYPSRAVRVTVGYSAGGAVDVSARIVSQRLSEALGQPVVVENRPGADGNLASELVAKSAPDGHTLAFVSAGHTMNPAMYPKSLPYHPVKDFSPISMLAAGAQTLVVNPSLPVRNVKELVALAKARPGAINFASSGYGGPMHLAGELLKSTAGINIVHVPYKGGGPAVNDVIAGQVEMTFVGAPASLPFVRNGRLRLIAVSTAKRMSTLPDTPTVAESGYPGFDIPAYYSVLAPANTPAPIVNRLHTELVKIVQQKEVRDRLASFGVETVGNSPAELTAFMTSDVAKWSKLVQGLGLKTE
jgi:tripartite-type tricarboxylate transporter receptor subunit TctC